MTLISLLLLTDFGIKAGSQNDDMGMYILILSSV